MNLITSPFQHRVALLRWTLPLMLGLLMVFYEVGPGRLLHDLNTSAYFGLDIAFYGLVVPLITFASLTLFNHWLNEKERVEREARASEQHLASIMRASADAIIGVDSEGHIEFWNRGAELLFGNTVKTIRGKSLAILLGGGESADVESQWLTANVQKTGFIRAHETTCRTADGRSLAVELTATHLTDAEGRSSGMSVVVRDVTERKHREAEIRRLNASLNEQVAERTHELAQKVEELARANADLTKLDQTRSEFVSLVSHQIRAPLTNIQGAIEQMKGECTVANPHCQRMLVIVEQQVARLERLVRDVLNAARIEAGDLSLRPEPLSLAPIVQ